MKMALLVFKAVCRDAPEHGGRQVHLEGPGNVVSLGLYEDNQGGSVYRGPSGTQ